jgi:SAM-dependent methyltransferase
MPHPSTAAAYDQLAERWLDGTFDAANGLRQHERALAFLEPDAGGWVLNAGCGCNTRFNPLLRRHGLRIEGVDLSARMLALARAADPAVVLHQADIRDWPLPRSYRFVTAWDSIWHVRLEDQRALMLKLMRALEPGGIFLFTAGGLDEAGEHVDAAMGPEVYYGTLGIPGLLAVVEEAGCNLRHLEFDQQPEKHLVVMAQRPKR